MGLGGEPLPLLWTCDYIPKNPDDWAKGPYDRSCPDDITEYTVGEFNCSCVGISKFQAVCGGEKTLADVPDEDYFDACDAHRPDGRQGHRTSQKTSQKDPPHASRPGTVCLEITPDATHTDSNSEEERRW